jgi:NADH-quinone oxidoreductase subunit K
VTDDAVRLFTVFGIGVALTLVVGLYAILVTRNLIRTLIGLEVVTKGVTLLLVVTGKAVEHVALAQALVITLIVIEVVVIVVAVGLVLSVYRHTNSVDASSMKGLKG